MFHVGTSESFVWVVSREATRWQRLELTAEDATIAVARLRASLDPGQLGKPGAQLFDLGNAHDLYLRLLGPVASEISGKSHLLLVLPGALSALPVPSARDGAARGRSAAGEAAARSSRPIADVRLAAASRDADERAAVGRKPQGVALRVLRCTRASGAKPLIGFGDPQFGPIAAEPRAGQPLPAARRCRRHGGRCRSPRPGKGSGRRPRRRCSKSTATPSRETAD